MQSRRAESRKMNVLKRAKKVQEMTMRLYEPGNQSRSKAQAYRLQVKDAYNIGERTFWRYMSFKDIDQKLENVARCLEEAQGVQMVIPFD